jgi:hypothetical protein
VGLYSPTQDRFVAVAEGGVAPLADPPQGGEVLFAGVRALNLVCRSGMAVVNLSASLKDEAANRFVAIDGRTVQMKVDVSDADTVAESLGPANYANLPACPNAGATRDITGTSYLLHVRADVIGGKHAEASLHVVPSCGETAHPSNCECVCRAVGGSNGCMH